MAVLGHILIPNTSNFLRQEPVFDTGGRLVRSRKGRTGKEHGNRPAFTKEEGKVRAGLISNKESSFEGHTVNALVPTGDEGRDKLR